MLGFHQIFVHSNGVTLTPGVLVESTYKATIILSGGILEPDDLFLKKQVQV